MDNREDIESKRVVSILKIKNQMIKIKKNILKICFFSGGLFAIASRVVLAVDTPLLTPIPGSGQAVTKVTGMAEYLVSIYKFGLATIGILAMGMIMVGGFLYITGSYSGMVGKASDGKEIIKSALIGLAIGLLSWLLINTIDPNLTKIKDVLLTPPPPLASEELAYQESVKDCQNQCEQTCFSQGKIIGSAYVEYGMCACDCQEGSASTCIKIICDMGVPEGKKTGNPVYDNESQTCNCDYMLINEDKQKVADDTAECQKSCESSTACESSKIAVGQVNANGQCECSCEILSLDGF